MRVSVLPRGLRAGAAAMALLAGGLAQPARADDDGRRFEARLTTQEQLVRAPKCLSQIGGRTAGSGVATGMGTVTMAASDCVLTDGVSPVYLFTGGKLVLTAANGDKLTADYSGMLVPTAATTPEAPVYQLQGSYRVTGGTGRFTHATGAGVLGGSENLATGQGSFTASGLIRY